MFLDAGCRYAHICQLRADVGHGLIANPEAGRQPIGGTANCRSLHYALRAPVGMTASPGLTYLATEGKKGLDGTHPFLKRVRFAPRMTAHTSRWNALGCQPLKPLDCAGKGRAREFIYPRKIERLRAKGWATRTCTYTRVRSSYLSSVQIGLWKCGSLSSGGLEVTMLRLCG